MDQMINLVIIAILVFVLYKFVIKNNENFVENLDDDVDDKLFDDVDKKLSKRRSRRERKSLEIEIPTSCNNEIDFDGFENKYKRDEDDNGMFFAETQFHNDYRDVLTSFNNIAPAQKQLFNKEELPMKTIVPSASEVKDLIKSFIKNVNENIKTQVTDYLNGNSGWDEYMPEQNVLSGWEQQQKELGLPVSIYREPAKRDRIKLVKIDHVEKFATEKQIRYVCYLLVKKNIVSDKMLVKVSFVIDNKFKQKGDVMKVNVAIEQIFVMGYYGSNPVKDDFYKFKNIENDNGIDQMAVLTQLNDKKMNRKIKHREFSKSIRNPLIH